MKNKREENKEIEKENEIREYVLLTASSTPGSNPFALASYTTKFLFGSDSSIRLVANDFLF